VIVCTYEDRPSATTGIQLLALSLEDKCPDAELLVYCGFDDAAFKAWADRRKNIRLLEPPSDLPCGWDVKPTLLLEVLSAGAEAPWWLDTDIVVTRDWRGGLSGISGATLVVAEERASVTGHNTSDRTSRLGLPVGRSFPRALCTCAFRVTSEHRDLLLRWEISLRDVDYRRTQELPFDQRDWRMGSDQDVFEGLLGSAQFASIPIVTLRSGRDVAHCFCGYGYTFTERARNLFTRLPPLVHAQGPKPWDLQTALFSELSPYCAIASRYLADLSEPAPWLLPRSVAARVLNAATAAAFIAPPSRSDRRQWHEPILEPGSRRPAPA
jgi:hypothetical protein